MKKAIPLIFAFGALLFAGCASTHQYVPMPDQTKTVEDPSKGRIYVVRPASLGYAVSMNVSEDGKPIGATGSHGFICWERPPGDSIVSSASEGVSQVPLTVDAGHVYYVFQHLRMGLLIARNELELVDEEKGRKALKNCHAARVETPKQTVMPAPPKE
jgi:hypothetical protein